MPKKSKSVVLTKVEHHQVNYHYKTVLTYDQLADIYSDLEKSEIKEAWENIKNGDEHEINQLMDYAFGEVDIEWDMEYEDNWTDRKGGYDVTYGIEKG